MTNYCYVTIKEKKFNTGIINPNLKMNTENMHEELLEHVQEGELEEEELPRISTLLIRLLELLQLGKKMAEETLCTLEF